MMSTPRDTPEARTLAERINTYLNSGGSHAHANGLLVEALAALGAQPDARALAEKVRIGWRVAKSHAEFSIRHQRNSNAGGEAAAEDARDDARYIREADEAIESFLATALAEAAPSQEPHYFKRYGATVWNDGHCPACASQNTRGSSRERDESGTRFHSRCEDCGHKWTYLDKPAEVAPPRKEDTP